MIVPIHAMRLLITVSIFSTWIINALNNYKIISLPTDLNIDKSNILIAGYDNSADFSHQFHIAFSSIISRSCIFSGQPFHCAVSKFNQDTLIPQTNNSRVPYCDGCPPFTTLEFNHCKVSPNVVDVGSLVDYPRRHCGQNPIRIHECFDDVYYLQNSRVFISRNSKNDTFGAVENTVALLAQMISNPQNSIKMVTDEKDEPGACLRHVYNAPWMKPGKAIQLSWQIFNQSEYFNQEIGFQNQGWIYIPQRCKKESGDQICKLIIRPDKCSPPNNQFTPDINEFANYAETNAMILLHPCLGGKVNIKKYPNSYDIQNGKLDVYGQLTNDYVQQSAPHMDTIGKMIRRLLNIVPSINKISKTETINKIIIKDVNIINKELNIIKLPTLPTLNIDRKYIMTAGCSNTADFGHQFHVAFSSFVTGSCVFSGMPFHCAVTRFQNDFMIPKTASTAAGIHCDGCDSNNTLIYDHCKNHPHWVDINTITHFAETANNIDDPKIYLANARVFSFGPTHDRCYQPPSMENIANFYLKYAINTSQIKLVTDQPFPHSLPTNSTPYFNDIGNITGAGYDGPGECLKHVFGNGHRLWAASNVDPSWWKRMNVSEYVTDKGIGMHSSAWLFLPPQCQTNNTICKLLILPGGCNAEIDPAPPMSGSDNDFAKYATENDIVILKPCQGAPINQTRFPQNHENLRGLCDVYGQLNVDYATQTGDQMAPIGRMMKKLIGASNDL
eukprot:35639_1